MMQRGLKLLVMAMLMGMWGCGPDAPAGNPNSQVEMGECVVGGASCPCYPNNTCDEGLSCDAGRCVSLSDPLDMPSDVEMSLPSDMDPLADAQPDLPAPPPCLDLLPLRAWETQPSAVAVLFTALDCATGAPFPFLSGRDFVVQEDGRPLSSESALRIATSQGLRVYVTLLLDLSDSTRPNLTQLISASQQFIDTTLSGEQARNIRIGIELFDGSALPQTWQLPTDDASLLKSRLAALESYQAPDASSTNLNGALSQGVVRLQERQQQVMAQNFNGTVTSGYLVVFTDGGDTAGRVPAAEASASVAAARVYDPQQRVPTVQTVAVALQGGDYQPAELAALVGGGERVAEASEAGQLAQAFEDIAKRIKDDISGTYLLVYCSPARAGEHTVSVGVMGRDGVMAQSRTNVAFGFNAEGFTGGCNNSFFETVCEDKACGGLNCGACDDATQVCSGETSGQCVSACLSQNRCQGEMITNALGYSQSCDLGDEVTRCSGQCTDLSLSNDHCGSCGNRCVAQGSSCVAGVCTCSGGDLACGNSCVEAQTDNNNCGACGNRCVAPGSSCVAGVCTCLGGELACGSSCVDLQTDNNNCGTCGNRCAQGGSCVAGTCMCPPENQTCNNFCVNTLVDNNNCGVCGNVCQVVSCSAGQCLVVSQISAGGVHTCALLNNGSIRCWGYNGSGQLGNSTTTNRTTPVAVNNLSNVQSISSGFEHTCALLNNGTVRCWGRNDNGQLGDGTTTGRTTSVAVSNLSNVQSLSAGEDHTCALLNDGTVRCWGRNNYGKLGDGTTTNRTTPVAVSNLSNVQSLSAGSEHTCALLNDGTARCWGKNSSGQLGDGTTTNRTTPVVVSNLSNVQSLSAGNIHTCALLNDGTVRCWGFNVYGQLGDGTTTGRTTSVAVNNLSNVQSLSAGENYTCALLNNSTVRCWGINEYGKLGDGTTTNRTTPVAVSNLSNVQSLSAGNGHTCALLNNGTVRCWGFNPYGQLGDGTTTNRLTSTSVVW